MPRLYVLYDVNVYRNPALSGEVTSLRAAERGQSIIATAHTGTVVELLVHLADVTDEHRQLCLRALRAVWNHCLLYNGSTDYVPMLQTSSLVFAVLFGRDAKENEREVNGLHALLRHVATKDDLQSIQRSLSLVAKRCQEREAQFVGHFRRYADGVREADERENLSPDQLKEWRRAGRSFFAERVGEIELARTRVRHAAAQLHGPALSDEAVDDLARKLVEAFPVAVAFFSEFARRVVMDNADPARRANSLWDYELAYLATAAVAGNDVPIRLVTGDGELLSAAERLGRRGQVMTLDEHRAWLKIPAGPAIWSYARYAFRRPSASWRCTRISGRECPKSPVWF